jgi:hypothetical protein
MFSKELTFAGHTRTFSVDPLLSRGWEVRVVHDSDVVRRTCYSDWHRVERAISAIEREVSQLEAQGWRTAAPAPSTSDQSTNR